MSGRDIERLMDAIGAMAARKIAERVLVRAPGYSVRKVIEGVDIRITDSADGLEACRRVFDTEARRVCPGQSIELVHVDEAGEEAIIEMYECTAVPVGAPRE